MHPYALLGIAIATEVAGTTALKFSDGMTKLGPSVVVVIGYGFSFWLLALTLKSMPIGLVYAVWSGLGVAAIAIVGVYWFDEPLNLAGIAGLALIILGVVVLQLSGSGAH
ncbi:MAG: multidrug efflux SMR transporter [Magnetovibrio sp.]|nr:multidrug efflux SMR transporter [Magnetovibrio sp.]